MLPLIGRLERVLFMDFVTSNGTVVAKIDTGADSGAMHCEYVKLINRDGKKTLEFQPINRNWQKISTVNFRLVRVRSSNGTHEKRYRIQTRIRIRELEYPIDLTLTDRSYMQYDVIIGSRFLKNRFLVDVSRENI